MKDGNVVRRKRLHRALDAVLDGRVNDQENDPQTGWRVEVDRAGDGTVEGPAPKTNGISGVFFVKMDKGGTLRVHKDRMRRIPGHGTRQRTPHQAKS